MLTKGLWIYFVVRITKAGHAIAIERAVMMAQGGEFAFVLFSAAATHSVISADTHANLTAIVVMSMVLTPLFLVIHQKYTAKTHRQRL